MENSTVTVKVNKKELVNSKFTNTLSTVEGYYREAKEDVSVGQAYTANAVYRRIAAIKEALLSDLEKLSNDVEITQNGS